MFPFPFTLDFLTFSIVLSVEHHSFGKASFRPCMVWCNGLFADIGSLRSFSRRRAPTALGHFQDLQIPGWPIPVHPRQHRPSLRGRAATLRLRTARLPNGHSHEGMVAMTAVITTAPEPRGAVGPARYMPSLGSGGSIEPSVLARRRVQVVVFCGGAHDEFD